MKTINFKFLFMLVLMLSITSVNVEAQDAQKLYNNEISKLKSKTNENIVNQRIDKVKDEGKNIINRWMQRRGDPCALICPGDDYLAALLTLGVANNQWLDGKFPYGVYVYLDSDAGSFKKFRVSWPGLSYNYSRRPYAFTVRNEKVEQVFYEANQ